MINKIRIFNDSPISNKARVTIGDQIIPVMSVDIHMEPGEFTSVTVKVPSDFVDVTGLLKQATVVMAAKKAVV